ncbi:MAG: tRNA (adenosine(37)-N6)-threonylcarbamoyltransferase complex dimerization subunit type 1 TsaB [Micropepsaceae bacterium]
MLILALDTALGACSAALANAEGPIARRYEAMTTGHAAALAPMADAVMREAGHAFADLTRIAVTTGPGTFTGQRIGLAFARGLSLALKIPCIGVTTLEAMAAAARTEAPGHPILAASDARKGEAYAQLFAADGTPQTEPALLTLEAAAALITPDTILAGTAADLLTGGIASTIRQPDAVFVAALALSRPDTGPPHPLYLRAPDAKLPGPLKGGPGLPRRA